MLLSSFLSIPADLFVLPHPHGRRKTRVRARRRQRTSWRLKIVFRSLKEVQDFPEDFDGVVRQASSHCFFPWRLVRADTTLDLQVVGSPANWQTHLQAWSIHMNLNTQPSTSSHFMTEDMWTDVLAPEVMRQCDALDGVCDLIGLRTSLLSQMLLLACRWNHKRSEKLRVGLSNAFLQACRSTHSK